MTTAVRLVLMAGVATLVAACMAAPPEGSEARPVAFEGAYAQGAAQVAHGARLTDVLGCTSCHGVALTGGSYADDPDGELVFASNLTRVLAGYTDAQIEALLRTGTHPRRDALYYMPAKSLQRLSDADMGALIAYLRSLEPQGRDWPGPREGEGTQALVAMGILSTSGDAVEAYRLNPAPGMGEQFALGRYVASVTCAECHGPDLSGVDPGAPGLQHMDGYSAAELDRLLADGVTRGGDAHGMMALVARRELSALTDAERAAVIAYVEALAAAK
ncbi:cytochrome c [Sphingomicrobium astaxanthinifaciens]|uniref:cytochrome c n=1 Tax=Sphingomicrobium astaxanthinifaciens TaxID=1227949 RepID=UPI001FCA4E9D|nr:c-type cytochrome [Sphingomicrobium astaxanthinifaciens]MCJ7421907.1 c-type cytochrome [Sphingomicrobium astaxanthinifaciens]